MEKISDLINNLDVHLVILIRIMLAIFLSFILGIERELTGKIAGLRTHILVSLGACVFTILSIYGFKMHETIGVIGTNDPARIAAQVITGIGFIGAGTVMRHGSNVFGITTAATLWVCASIGMSCGCGEYITAVIASVLTLFVLISIRRLEKDYLSKKKMSYVIYQVSLSAPIDECDTIQDVFSNNFKKIYKINKKLVNSTELKFSAVISTKKTLKDIYNVFKAVQKLESIEIREYYE